jgi:hypothetical protein
VLVPDQRRRRLDDVPSLTHEFGEAALRDRLVDQIKVRFGGLCDY